MMRLSEIEEKETMMMPLLESKPESYSSSSSCSSSYVPKGFVKGIINLGELHVTMVKHFIFVATYTPPKAEWVHSVTFYKPPTLPTGWFTFGHYTKLSGDQQPNNAYILAATPNNSSYPTPPFELPLSYTLIWTSGTVFVWKPNPPLGYRALGFVVTADHKYGFPTFPDPQLIRCVRDDLTEYCQLDDHHDILGNTSTLKLFNFKELKTTRTKSVNVGSIFSSTNQYPANQFNSFCLKILNPHLEAMPNLEQLGELIHHHGPILYFHPHEVYFPSTVPWFFNNANSKHGNLHTAHPYIHVKPALGATFTDIQMSFFYPSKPTKLFKFNIKKHHLGYWEHFTLRFSNFDGQLYSLYFSDHKWVHPTTLDFTHPNKPIVYSSKFRHSTFPNPGTYIQTCSKLLPFRAKNHVAKSNHFIDTSKNYHIIEQTILVLLLCHSLTGSNICPDCFHKFHVFSLYL